MAGLTNLLEKRMLAHRLFLKSKRMAETDGNLRGLRHDGPTGTIPRTLVRSEACCRGGSKAESFVVRRSCRGSEHSGRRKQKFRFPARIPTDSARTIRSCG